MITLKSIILSNVPLEPMQAVCTIKCDSVEIGARLTAASQGKLGNCIPKFPSKTSESYTDIYFVEILRKPIIIIFQAETNTVLHQIYNDRALRIFNNMQIPKVPKPGSKPR